MGSVGAMTRWAGRYPMTPNLWIYYSRLIAVVNEQMQAMMLPKAMTPTVFVTPVKYVSPTVEMTFHMKATQVKPPAGEDE